MKFPQVGAAILAFLACAQVGEAAGRLLGPRKAALVGQSLTHDKDKKEMPTVKHTKTAGDDYEPGSPLHEKQEQRKAAGIVSDTSMPGNKQSAEKDAGVTTLPPPTDVNAVHKHWWDSHNPSSQGFWTRGLYFFLSYFINTVLAAFIWMKCLHPAKLIPYWKDSHNERENKASKEFASMGFAYGLFSTTHCCGHHLTLCCCTYFATPLRLADTYSKGPEPLIKGGFVVSLLVVTCLIGLSELTAGISVLVLFFFCIYMRYQIRKKYGMNTDGGALCQDCLSWYCCPCCTMAQEARQLDFVYPADPAQLVYGQK